MRSMSPTEIVTIPAITEPLSSTRLIRSASSSGVLSSTSPGIGGHSSREMVRGPGTGEIDAEPAAVMIADEAGHGFAEVIEPVVRDEERRVENRGTGLGVRSGQRFLRGVDGSRRQLAQG